MKVLMSVAATFSLFLLSACGGSSSSDEAVTLSEAEIGEMLFHDTNLSLHRNISCATCHDPEHAFVDARFKEDASDPTYGALSRGSDGVALGGRNAPTASYAGLAPEFSQDESGVYTGGQFHDGRAASVKEQAKGPFIDSAEMMMPDAQSVIERIKENSEYVTAIEAIYGQGYLNGEDTQAIYDSIAQMIAKFEKTELFSPFDSKYDLFLACKEAGNGEGFCYEDGNWSIEEQAGYALFFSNNNTNCVSCHTLNSQSEASSRELFTNYKYENIGTPRNTQALIARDGDTQHLEKGLGGFLESEGLMEDASEHYGKIKVPTLRNIAVSAPYMSNGVFQELRTVLAFYDHMAGQGGHPVNPETGQAWQSNDYNATINNELLRATRELTDDKIRNLEAFLRTLTDARYEDLLEPLAP